jgi:signal transduction histidine kinase/CheY-like chemotaxis protein
VYEAQLRRKDGSRLDVFISERELPLANGASQGRKVLVTDNSEHKRADLMFRRAQKSESLARMAGGIAHDFNNLFQALQSNLELVLGQIHEPARIGPALERSLLILAKASALSSKMLDYSGQGFTDAQSLHLGRLLEEHAGQLREVCQPGSELLFELPAVLPEIAGDPQQLLEVVDALLCNADEASVPGPSRVRIAVERLDLRPQDLKEGFWPEPAPEGAYVALTVQDHGAGMDAATLDKLFEPFFSTKSHGRGLGLASSLGIIRAHHGYIQVLTAPGRGTRVRLLFSPCPEPGAQAGPVAATHRTILLVDDDEDLRTTLREVLGLLGHDVLVAQDGREGLEVFQANADRIDLILMDATMPRMDGLETFARIKVLRPGARAILCSGYSEALGRERAQAYGFLGFLKKPFPIRQLKQALEQALAE